MDANKIDTEYKDGTIILTHPSGHIDIYTPADIKKHRDRKQTEVDRLTGEIAQDNILILRMES